MRIENIQASITREELLENLIEIKPGMWEVDLEFYITFTMVCDDGRRLECQVKIFYGFLTDLITDPFSLLLKMGIDKMDYIFAPILHDRLVKYPVILYDDVDGGEYPRTMRLDQKPCDEIFQDTIQWEGLDYNRAHFMYKILRNYGWIAWVRWCFWRMFGWFDNG